MTRNATVTDASQLKYCISGMRTWFEDKDMTFREFCRNGASVEWLRSQNHAMATKLADFVEAEEARKG